ncbi:class I SAM-dependent methyltransferase [Deminuibacter soli]|uniref:S-adenosyl-L-methionine-dependent methyltransferase n=1 Tax=Deminuibacter soli TaxID=2291815 RepID=A0A3E1NEU4_9BACT|nr:SAM-dependent methyltransferase [Deminuibacter soli]RFM26505.1 class I SAM-dependent methyltransferase [Deminuibacter soli]
MKQHTASKTARYMALFRAMETRRPAGERLFSDPYAARFLPGILRLAAKLFARPGMRTLLTRYIVKRIPGAMSSAQARTRYIDDLLLQTLPHSRQLIILGAGFDTRALRLPALQQLPVIEIDHPATAARKQQALQHMPAPAHIRYLHTDFNNESLQQLLHRQHVNLSLPGTVIWEGVTNYLTRPAIDAVFSTFAALPPGSAIIFTYVHAQVLQQPASFYGAPRLLRDLQQIGEQWLTGFHPHQLATYLQQFGLQLTANSSADDYRNRYIPSRREDNKGYGFYYTAMAVIP